MKKRHCLVNTNTGKVDLLVQWNRKTPPPAGYELQPYFPEFHAIGRIYEKMKPPPKPRRTTPKPKQKAPEPPYLPPTPKRRGNLGKR